MEYIGSFELGYEVDITDPCYDRGHGGIITECEPGTYAGYVERTDDRVAELIIAKGGADPEYINWESIGCTGVDAGLAGFFNNKPNYEGDEWRDFLVKSGVFKDANTCDYEKDCYVIENGIFSESGYGDGCYEIFANKNRTAFRLVFIEDEDEEEWDDDGYIPEDEEDDE